jgi:hypothetical protein
LNVSGRKSAIFVLMFQGENANSAWEHVIFLISVIMKKSFLFSAIIILVSCNLFAQDQLHRKVFPGTTSRVDLTRHQIPPNQKTALPIVCRKQNKFNPSNSVWKWDTILSYNTSSNTIPFQRISRSYDSMGKVLSQLTERRQGSFNWENLAMETYTYDSAGNELTYFAEKWENNSWTDFMKEATVYNANGDRVDWRREQWQSTFWAKWEHYTWHYIAPGLYDTVLIQAGQDSLWVNTALEIDTYDTNNYLTNILTYTWTNNSWVFNQLEFYAHDSIGNHLSLLVQNWQNGSWINSFLSISTFDTASNRLSATVQVWQNNSWVNYYDISYAYDSAGNLLLESERHWSGNAWVNFSQNLYEYDGSNNLLKSTFQNGTSSGWQNSNQQQYTYDTSGNSLTGKWLIWYNGNWHPDNGILRVFSDHQVDYDVWLSDLYRYSVIGDSVMVSVETTQSFEKITLFPNPAHSIVYISSRGSSTAQNGSMTFYDLRGKLVLTKQIVNATTGIDVSALKPGVYFVRFSNNQMTSVSKFVKD